MVATVSNCRLKALVVYFLFCFLDVLHCFHVIGDVQKFNICFCLGVTIVRKLWQKRLKRLVDGSPVKPNQPHCDQPVFSIFKTVTNCYCLCCVLYVDFDLAWSTEAIDDMCVQNSAEKPDDAGTHVPLHSQLLHEPRANLLSVRFLHCGCDWCFISISDGV